MIRRVSACISSKRALTTNQHTTDKVPHLLRASRFNPITPHDVVFFRGFLQESCIVDQNDVQLMQSYNTDWLGKYRGKSGLVLRPKNTVQVSKILRYCNENMIAVVPQSGNTGLVGGGVPVHDEVILSLSLMDNVKSFDANSGILECEAGCILEKLDLYLSPLGSIMPLDLGAKGSCLIGGNVATNAGGLRLLRYGSLHGTVLALEVVLPNGQIMNLGKPLRKDNTGYDLKHLFIGSEGTLGIITGVTILTAPKPKSINVAVLGLDSYANVMKVFKAAKTDLAEVLSAFEFFDADSLHLVLKHTNCRAPMGNSSKFYILIETSGSNQDHDSEKLESFLEKVLEDGHVEDGVLAQDQQQIKDFWSIRESIPMACVKQGFLYKYDLSVPVANLYDLVNVTKDHLAKKGYYRDGGDVTHIVGFGHMGDGNLHLNIMSRTYSQCIEEAIEPFIYEETRRYHGSISAEHGLGLMKAPYLKYSQTDDSIQLMKKMKQLFDPNGIMNPYKYFPSQ